jgi:hypothetical protein
MDEITYGDFSTLDINVNAATGQLPVAKAAGLKSSKGTSSNSTR